MSEPYPEIDEKLWEEYVSWCQANNVWPSISDYSVWLEDSDKDTEAWDEYSSN